MFISFLLLVANFYPQPSDYVQANLLIQPSPVPCYETIQHLSIENRIRLLIAVYDIGVQEQIINHKDLEYWSSFFKPSTISSDFDIIKKRRTILSTYPRIEEAPNFPPLTTINKALQFNYEYRAFLVQQQRWNQDRYYLYETAIQETDELSKIWNKMASLQMASQRSDLLINKRIALGEYKKLVGEKLWNSKEMPEYVPIWRFYTNER